MNTILKFIDNLNPFNFIAYIIPAAILLTSKRYQHKRTLKGEARRYTQEIYKIEFNQELCNAELQELHKKEKEDIKKVEEMEELLTEKYKDNRHFGDMKLLLERQFELEKATKPDTGTLKAIEEIKKKVGKAKELLGSIDLDIDIKVLGEEIDGLGKLKMELKGIPIARQDIEKKVQENIDHIGRIERTIKLAKAEIRKI